MSRSPSSDPLSGILSKLVQGRVAHKKKNEVNVDYGESLERIHGKTRQQLEEVETVKTLVRENVAPTEESIDVCKQAIVEGSPSKNNLVLETRNRAWEALEHLAVREVNVPNFLSHGVPSLCQQTIETESQDERVKALTTLRELSIHSQAQVPLASGGVTQVCEQVIREGSSSSEERMLALETLYNLSLNHTNQVRMVKVGVLSLCVDIVASSTSRGEEKVEALATLEKLSSNVENCSRLIESGVVETCLGIIDADDPEEEEHRLKAWRVVLHLTCDGSNLIKLLEKGVIERCPKGIDQQDCLATRVLALAVTQNLAYPSDRKAYLARDLGMVDRCVRIIATDTTKARTYALGVLQNLTDCEVNAVNMLDSGVIQACALAIQQRGSHATRINALRTLQNLAWPMENKLRMVHFGVDNICIQAGEMCTGEARTKALATLQNLSLHPETPSLMLSSRLLRLCSMVVQKQHATEARVIALAILHVLAGVPANAMEMVSHNVADLCLGVLNQSVRPIEQWRNGTYHGYSIEGYAFLTLLTLAHWPAVRPRLDEDVLKMFLDVFELGNETFRLLSLLGIAYLGDEDVVLTLDCVQDLERCSSLLQDVIAQKDLEDTFDLSWKINQLLEPLSTFAKNKSNRGVLKELLPCLLRLVDQTKQTTTMTLLLEMFKRLTEDDDENIRVLIEDKLKTRKDDAEFQRLVRTYFVK